jgi:hypothetical protein
MALSDSLTGINRNRAVVTDDQGANLSDTASFTTRTLYSWGDSTSMNDGMVGLLRFRIAIVDDQSGNLSDLVAHILNNMAGVTPLSYSFTDDYSSAISESFSGITKNLGAVSDSLGITDSFSGLSLFRIVISDNQGANLSDIVNHILNNIGVATPLSYSFSEDQSANFNDGILILMPMRSSLSESNFVSDGFSGIGVNRGNVSDSIAYSEAMSALGKLIASISDDESANLNDRMGGLLKYKAILSEDQILADAVYSFVNSPGVVTVGGRSYRIGWLGGLKP